MTTVYRCLVVENDPTDDCRRLGEWLTEGGLELVVCRPHDGEPLPDGLHGYAAVVVLGGDQHAFEGSDGQPGAVWFPQLENLLRHAVRNRVATLGVCLGAQLLAVAHAGTVVPSPAGPEIGAQLVAKRDAADNDVLFGSVPMLPDVLQWHYDEVADLPAGAVVLAASTRYPHQAFRLGDRAWGLQFHIECDTAMMADWVAGNEAELGALGLDPAEVVAGADQVMEDLAQVWRPFALRFAAVARGELSTPGPARPRLPLLDR